MRRPSKAHCLGDSCLRARLLGRQVSLDERGLGGVEVLPIGVLVMTVVTIVVMMAWTVIDAKFGATAAAREGARTAVETFDVGAARTAAGRAWRDHGQQTPLGIDISGELTRCGRITVTATAVVAAIPVPVLRGWSSTPVRSVHSEVVDPYRSGLASEATCSAATG